LSIPTRIKQVIEGLSVAKVAQMLDEKESRVRSVVYGKQRVPEDFLIKFVQVFQVDANWLLLGVGEPPKPELTSVEAALLDNFRHCPTDEQDAIIKTSALLAQRPGKKNLKNAG